MKIAIRGHKSRGKEIIQILRSLGATSYGTYDTCSHPEWYWYINKNKEITCDPKRSMCDYKLYTLEEFERKFPFKIGDKVIVLADQKSYKIIALEYYNGKLCYVLDNNFHYQPRALKLYKEMKKERNVTLTLDKAKEWYDKGGELKEVALQAYSEEELIIVKLPKTWEEFCENYPVQKGECFLYSRDVINQSLYSHNREYRNWIPSKKSAEAHLAMMQLEQLRDCWRQGWIPTPTDTGYRITKTLVDDYVVLAVVSFKYFLAFPTKEMAEEFLKCFRDLIEKAGDLI